MLIAAIGSIVIGHTKITKTDKIKFFKSPSNKYKLNVKNTRHYHHLNFDNSQFTVVFSKIENYPFFI